MSQPLPTPHPALKRLDTLVGKWNPEGRTIGSRNEPVILISGTDKYEWLPGDFFLIHWVDVQMGDQKADAIEIIGGYDTSSQPCPMRSFDNQGNTGSMQATVSERELLALHGVGPKAIEVVRNALAERGWSFAEDKHE